MNKNKVIISLFILFSITGWYLYDTNNFIHKNTYEEFAGKEAREELEKEGTPKAQYTLGLTFYSNKNYRESFKWFRHASEQGLKEAQFMLGVSYIDGKGTKIDNNAAFHLFKKSAYQGYAPSQNNIGYMYKDGSIIKQDYNKAFKWFKKASTQGNMNAQYNLGKLYKEGKGVTENILKAYIWFNLASSQGHQQAEKARDKVRSKISSIQLEEAQKLSEEYYEKYVNKNNI